MLKNGWIFLILLFVVFGCSYKKKWKACVVENTSLRAKNKKLSTDNMTLSSMNTNLREKNEKLSTDNRNLSNTNDDLTSQLEKNIKDAHVAKVKNEKLSTDNRNLSNTNDDLTSQLEKNIKDAHVAKVKNIIELTKEISFAQVSDENDTKYFSQPLKDILDNPDKDLVNVEARLNNDKSNKSNEALKRLEEEANEVFETRVKIVYLLFGYSHIEQGEYAKAKEMLDKAIEIDRNFVDALYYRAYVYYEQNDEDKAKTDARQVLKKHPDPRDLFKSLGLTQER